MPKPTAEIQWNRHVHRDGRAAGPYSRVVLKWKLTFAKLTGPRYAYLHRFKPDGAAGKVLFRLCMPCRNGHRERSTTSTHYLKLILAGKAFVGVYTVWGQPSEIRGQIKAVKVKTT